MGAYNLTIEEECDKKWLYHLHNSDLEEQYAPVQKWQKGPLVSVMQNKDIRRGVSQHIWLMVRWKHLPKVSIKRVYASIF